MILRELITRFGFDVDTKGVDKYDKTVDGMQAKAKKSFGMLKKFAGVLGVGLSVKEFLGLGLTVKQITADLKRLAGTDLINSKFQKSISKVRSDLEGVKVGAGNILTDKKANALASFFIKNVGKSDQKIKDFGKTLTVASLAALQTDRSLEEVFTSIVSDINSGGAGSIGGLGGINKPEQGRIEFVMNASNIKNDPTGENNRNIRRSIFSNVIDQMIPVMADNLKKYDDDLFILKTGKKLIKDTINSISEDAMNKGARFIRDISDVPDKGFEDAFFGNEKVKPVFKGGGVINRGGVNEKQSIPIQHIHNTENNITNNFKIDSDNPEKIKTIIKESIREEFKAGRSTIIKKEDR